MQVRAASAEDLKSVLAAVPADKPPLDYLLLRSMLSWSEAEWWLRLPALFATLGAGLLVGWLAHQAFGRRGASTGLGFWSVLLVGVLLYGSAPNVAFHVQQLVPYAHATFWITLAAIAAWLALERGSLASSVLVCIPSLAAAMTLYQAAFPLAGIAAGVLIASCWRRRLWLGLGISGAIAAAFAIAILYGRSSLTAAGSLPRRGPSPTFIAFLGCLLLGSSAD